MSQINRSPFDFNSIADLGTFWDGGTAAGGWGGGTKGEWGGFNNVGGVDKWSSPNVSHNIDLLYQNLIGRNADAGGRKYWQDKVMSGENTYQTVADAIKASDEYIGQQAALAGGATTGDQLKNLDTAYIDPFNQFSGSSLAGWSPPGTEGGSKLNQTQADSIAGGYSDHANKTVGQAKDWVLDQFDNYNWQTGEGGFGSMFTPYDDSGLKAQISGLQSAFDKYKTESEQNMQNMWNNANWGWGQTVGGVRTQNELPGWMPKKGGTSGFFGRGGRAGKGLTTGSLNI